MVPGRALHRIAARICNPNTLDLVIEPAIADLQQEYTEVAPGSALLRVRVLFVGYLAILEVMLMCALQPSPSRDGERRALVRTLVWAAGITVCASAVLILMSVAVLPGVPLFFLALITSLMLPIALPVGLMLGVAMGLAGRTPSRRVIAVVLVASLAAVAISYATMVWSWPVATYSFRQSLANSVGAGSPVVRAANDISASAIQQQPYFGPGGDRMAWAKRRAWTRHLRDAMAFAAPALAMLALALLRLRASRAAMMAACAGYFLLVLAGERLVYEGLPPLAAAWLANIVSTAAAAIVIMRPAGPALGRPA
jgi:hypothetical protein